VERIAVGFHGVEGQGKRYLSSDLPIELEVDHEKPWLKQEGDEE